MESRKGISVEELGKQYGLGRNTAYNVIKQPDFPAVRIGKKIVIITELADTWFKKQAEKKDK